MRRICAACGMVLVQKKKICYPGINSYPGLKNISGVITDLSVALVLCAVLCAVGSWHTLGEALLAGECNLLRCDIPADGRSEFNTTFRGL